MAKFGINDILNAKTKAAGQQAQTEGYKEIYLSPYEVKAAQENTHQKLENIEELADSFLHVGQEQPTVLARVNGEYRIIDGHRRNAANILNLERGHKEYEKVLYRFMDMSEAMYELRLLAGNGYTQELTAYEKTRLVERTKAALIRAKEEDGLEIQGKMRDLVAAMINESSTNVARMDAINNNATPEIKEQLKEGNLGITAAYEAAKLDEDLKGAFDVLGYKFNGNVHVEGENEQYFIVTVTANYEFGGTLLNKLLKQIEDSDKVSSFKANINQSGKWSKVGVVVKTNTSNKQSFVAITFKIENPNYNKNK